ncbi:MAG: hypothetical protein II001_06395, partial [Bacteroidales bacterium]|nr:hypothetical protein [Bacteroidales bacterium]
NFYDLMIFDNYTIDEISIKILSNYSNNEKNYLIKTFYNDLELAFNSKKEKNNIGNIYQDFEDITDFTCDNIFSRIDIITEIKNDASSSSLKNIIENLIEICEFTKITETNDFRTVFERHFQYIRNGMSALSDLSYEGIITHLINDKYISRVSMFFDIIVINILQLTNSQPHKEAFNRIIKKLKSIVLISEIIYLGSDIMAILWVSPTLCLT